MGCFLKDFTTLITDTHTIQPQHEVTSFGESQGFVVVLVCWSICFWCSMYWHVCCLYLQGLRPSPALKHTRLHMERKARSSVSSAALLRPTASWVPPSTLKAFLTFSRFSDESWILSPHDCGDFISFDRLSLRMYSTLMTYDTHNKWNCILNHLFPLCVL